MCVHSLGVYNHSHSTDHALQLVWRYLQEHGFEQTARAFTGDWHRSSSLRDPESLPFAHAVGRNELVSTLQYGISYDALQSQVRKQELRFGWSRIDARASIDRHDDPTENGAGSRPSTSRRKAKASADRAQDEFPTPQPKRQRRSEGSEAHVNGAQDPMDVDAASAEGEEEPDAASPTVTSEPEQVVEVMERYDSMDVMVQTDFKTGPKSSTMSWHVDGNNIDVQRALWNPMDDGQSRTLLTVGDGICRFYQVPNSFVNTKQVRGSRIQVKPAANRVHAQLTHADEPTLQDQGSVTAAAWCGDGKAACCALDGMRNLPGGGQAAQQTLLEIALDGSRSTLHFGWPTLEPPGVIMDLQYSPKGRFILARRENAKRSLIQVWNSTQGPSAASSSPADPVAWKLFDGHVSDATWADDDSFIVCGTNGVAAWYQIDDSQQKESGMSVTSVDMRGLISRNANILHGSGDWSMVKLDSKLRLAAFAAKESRQLLLSSKLRVTAAEETSEYSVALPENKSIACIAFQPSPSAETNSTSTEHLEAESLLAASLDDGSFHVYSVQWSSSQGIECKELAVLALTDPPASVLAWSPDGEHLAVANAEIIQIWSVSSFSRKNGEITHDQALVTWRPDDIASDKEDEQSQPSLAWSADGESLAFAARTEVCAAHRRMSHRQCLLRGRYPSFVSTHPFVPMVFHLS